LYLKDIINKSILQNDIDSFSKIKREIELISLKDELPYLVKTRRYIDKHKIFYLKHFNVGKSYYSYMNI